MGKNLTKATITLKFIGSPPFIAPMSPEEHTIRVPSILQLYIKLQRWFKKKYGYIIT